MAFSSDTSLWRSWMTNNGSINMGNAIYGTKNSFGWNVLYPEKVAKIMHISGLIFMTTSSQQGDDFLAKEKIWDTRFSSSWEFRPCLTQRYNLVEMPIVGVQLTTAVESTLNANIYHFNRIAPMIFSSSFSETRQKTHISVSLFLRNM